jgi:hypothetical protein
MNPMKNRSIPTLKIAALVAALSCGAGLRATTVQVTPVLGNQSPSDAFVSVVGFRDGAEAGQLRRAYQILATGDHDYKGHRAKAMHAVEAAAKLLGMDVAGDLKDRSPQALSDERLREAQGLITQVLGAAEVKNQKRVVKHLNEAVRQLDVALKMR